MLHKCKRCGYETTARQSLRTHLMKKKVCEPIISDTSITVLLQEVNTKQAPIYKETTYSCNYCQKKFNSTGNKSRHQKICKEKDKIITAEMALEMKSQIDILQKKVDELEQNQITIYEQPQNINNINNNITINIHLNQFNYQTTLGGINNRISKDELISMITSNINDLDMKLLNIIKDVHFNNNILENNNVKFINEEKSEIYEDDKWMDKQTISVLSDIFRAIHICVDDIRKKDNYNFEQNKEKYDLLMKNMNMIKEFINWPQDEKDGWMNVIKLLCDISHDYHNNSNEIME
jgi:hypothetical protein